MNAAAAVFPAEADYIGRDAAQALIAAVLARPAFDGSVYHITGQGGIGKTYLLREVHQAAKRLHDETDRSVLETGVIDLAHTRYQQPLLLMGAIARRLSYSLSGEPMTPGLFDSFIDAAAAYLSARGSLDDYGESQRKVREAFLEDYNRLANQHRIVLTIDTFERLAPNLPELEPYDFRPFSRLEGWLLELLGELQNTVTFIAGRVRERQARQFPQRLGARFRRHLALLPFSAAETREFMKLYAHHDYDDAWYERMHTISGGHPVQLIIALEVARACNFEPDKLPPSLTRPEGQVPLGELGADFFTVFIKQLRDHDPAMALLIEQASRLRKGLYLELLQYLAYAAGDVDAALEMPATLERFKRFAFVKQSGDKVATLHDDVYEMLDERINAANADPWYRDAINYLDGEIARVSEAIARDGMSIDLLGELRTAQLDRLSYQLAREPALFGYQNYCELSYGAILSHEEDFDTQLQDELARHFDATTAQGARARRSLIINNLPWEHVICNEAVRWVYRRAQSYTSAGDHYPEALKLAMRAERDYQDVFSHNELVRSALEVARLDAERALAFLPDQVAAIRQRYNAVVRALEGRAQAQGTGRPIDTFVSQQSAFLLAYALNNWGSFERQRQRLDTAQSLYRRAARLYRSLGSETAALRATTLTNLAFALADQGQFELGLVYAQNALSLQRALGIRYREAGSQHVIALISLELNDITAAEQNIRRARGLLRDFGVSRNAALVGITEGNFWRWVGFRNRDDVDGSEQAYARALECFERAQSFFQSRTERIRLAEIHQGRGCALRSRGYARSLRGGDGGRDFEAARAELALALEHCPDDVPLAVALWEDIAVSYVNQRRFAEAEEVLQVALGKIPPHYALGPGADTADRALQREQQQYWLQLAQVQFQLALCAFGRGEPRAACEPLLHAFAALLRFSTRAQQVATFRTVLLERLVALREPELYGELRRTTYLLSQRLLARDAFFELDRIFGEVEEIAALL